MSKIYFQGKFTHRLKSYLALSRISIQVLARRMIGRPLVTSWSATFEMGVLFWRHQFNCAFSAKTMEDGRAYFDSLITSTGETFAITTEASLENLPKGQWVLPDQRSSDAQILYLHGGGYSFRSEISVNYAKNLAGILNIDLFMPEYRLTPEHAHPAQLEDALAAYKFMINEGVDPAKLVLIGDSAGGHLVLMLMQALKNEGLAQPALSICLCPWTDIGEHGDSFYQNDKYDLVQGYMARGFGEWLREGTSFTREDLSPICHDYNGLAPLYLQGAGREVLIDMICSFAGVVKEQGAEVVLDVWPDMIHNFQAYGQTHPDSVEAFARMKEMIVLKTQTSGKLTSSPRTITISPDLGF